MISTIILGILAMLILATGVIFFVILYQRRVITHQLELKKINAQKELELIQASIQSEEGERTRIAAELHDDVGATLASARLFLYKNKDKLYDEQTINQSKELLDESIKKIRDISHKLQPATLQHLGLQLALEGLIELFNRSGNIQAQFAATATIPRLSESTELSAYRICQELITNVLKHAGATYIYIEVGMEPGYVTITFMHDGLGLTHEMFEDLVYKKGATGLKNIVNRLKSITGNIQFSQEDELAYKTILTIPAGTGTT